MFERPASPYDLTDKEEKLLSEKGLVSRFMLESDDPRAKARIEQAKKLGWSKLEGYDRKVGDQGLWVMSREQHEQREEEKRKHRDFMQARSREKSGQIVEDAAIGSRGLRPVGRIAGTDVDFDRERNFRFKGTKVPVQKSQEE